jgi:hypothetical protein
MEGDAHDGLVWGNGTLSFNPVKQSVQDIRDNALHNWQFRETLNCSCCECFVVASIYIYAPYPPLSAVEQVSRDGIRLFHLCACVLN